LAICSQDENRNLFQLFESFILRRIIKRMNKLFGLRASKGTGLIAICFLLLSLSPDLRAQGPKIQYYYNPQTELSWAQCHIYQQGGSRQKIPFLPVISANYFHAPLGTENYGKDVAVDGLLVFIGNGIAVENVWNSYAGRRADDTPGNIDVSGKIVMFCYDFSDAVEEKLGAECPLTQRIAEAASRKASAVVLFSAGQEYPFLTVSYKKASDVPDIPVITVTKNSALNILASAGLDGDSFLKDWEESKKPPPSQELISRLTLGITGNFDKAETENFLFRYLKESIPGQQMDELASINEKALAFLKRIFQQEKDLKWQKLSVVYFRDFDSKIFYTHHWGFGWATGEGTFMVHQGGRPSFPLAVHENAHILTRLNWGDSSSFLSEGVGRYTEALAQDKDQNDRQTIEFMKQNKLFRLKEMLMFDIGHPGLETEIGYPAAGSFVGFLIETYGLKNFKEAFILEGRSSDQKEKEESWPKVFGKSIQDLEREWLNWLARTHKADDRSVQAYLGKISEEK
jgi:hypothetical protein